MIGRLRGNLIEKQPPLILIEAFGVGYEVLTPMTSIYCLGEIGDEVILYTHFVVREDSHQLFGFATKSDRRLFQELIKVSGIGAKMALAILSGMDSATLVHCIESQDHGLLCSIPGIGKKTAERLMIEMRDKINKLSLECLLKSNDSLHQTFEQTKQNSSSNQKSEKSLFSEAVNALETLGYKTKDAEHRIAKVKNQASSVEELIRMALKII